MDLTKANHPRFQATDSDKKAMWQVFARILPAGLLPLEKPSPLGDKVVIQKLMALSSGLTGKLTSILAQAAELAIRQKTECITLDLIEQAANFGIYKYPPVESETEHLQDVEAL